MTGFPHDRPSAVLFNVIKQILGALHLAHKRGPLLFFQDIPRKKDHELVSPEDVPFLIDHPDAIRIAVVTDSYIRPNLLNPFDQIFQVSGDGGIREMVREPAVDVTVKFIHVTPQTFQKRSSDNPARAIPCVDDDSQFSFEANVFLNIVLIRLDHLCLREFPFPRDE